MVFKETHKLLGLDERQVALSAFEDALELVNSKDRPEMMSKAIPHLLKTRNVSFPTKGAFQKHLKSIYGKAKANKSGLELRYTF